MILSLRQRHRRMFAGIGIVIPIAFGLGIAARKPVPVVAQLPALVGASARPFAVTVWERGDLFGKDPIQVRLAREGAAAGTYALAFVAPKDFAKPDLIVYWVEGNPRITDTLPPAARLLGAFCTPVLVLPETLAPGEGVVVLFSLADQEIVDVSKPFSIASESRVPRGPGQAENDRGFRMREEVWGTRSSPLRMNDWDRQSLPVRKD